MTNEARWLKTRLLAVLTSGAALAPISLEGCASATTWTDASRSPDAAPPADDSASPRIDAVVSSPDVTTTVPEDTAPPGEDVPLACTGNASTQCFTAEQLARHLANPPAGGGGGPDAGGPTAPDASIAPNGCVEPGWVQSSCCNPASTMYRQGELCCYTFCDQACCGRPFVVEGEMRLAPVIERGDWRGYGEDGTRSIPRDAPTRAMLASSWLSDARMEHASVAAFARFTLQLLAHGAPPELVSAAQHAALDEVDHARRCFALASRLAGRELGPGPLDMSSALPAQTPTLAELVAATIREGCVGETLAALVAAAQLGGACDDEARETLSVIARDEASHAELAWRFVAWALSQGDPSVRAAAERTFDRCLASPDALPVPGAPGAHADLTEWRAYGRLDGAQARALAHTALTEVLRPCVRAVLSGASPTVHGAAVPTGFALARSA